MSEAETEALDQFVARLRAVRIEQGLSLGSVARHIGVAGQAVVGNWERGLRRPRVDLLPVWAAHLGVVVPPGVSGWQPVSAPCGTVAGAETHRRRGEPVCRACRDARVAYRRARRQS